jgi:class 3 adenylate cyclase
MAGGLPTGTVTFLFTDIEGSTRLWERAPEAMELALAEHDRLVRAAIDMHAGYVFATTGDGFAAAFHGVGSAVAAAIDAQRALGQASWLSGAEIVVRMGAHTGPAHERGGDYFGPSVNRCARLMSAAHGGQIVVSSSVHAIAEDDHGWVELGAHRLRDLTTVEMVFQVVADGLGTSFPALRTADTLPGNIPRELTSFVGRSEEVADIALLLDSVPVVTLTGVGGVGKTRLALEAAAAAQAGFRDGAWFVELAAVTDGAGVPSAISGDLAIQTPQVDGVGCSARPASNGWASPGTRDSCAPRGCPPGWRSTRSSCQ